MGGTFGEPGSFQTLLFRQFLVKSGNFRQKRTVSGNPCAPAFGPKGPKIEKNKDCPPGLKFSSGIENFKPATRQSPFFAGRSEGRD